jgi:hypothetical protein
VVVIVARHATRNTKDVAALSLIAVTLPPIKNTWKR